MFSSVLVNLITALFVGGVQPAPQVAVDAAQVKIAQARPNQVDRAAARLGATTRARRALAAEKTGLVRRHDQQLKEVDRLKRARASWRRDRQLRGALAASRSTAGKLAAIDRRIRGVDARLRKQRYGLVREIDRELATGAPDKSRRARLTRIGRSTRRALRRSRKIILPDDEIDPLADPEDLEDQASRISQSERELEREIVELVERARRYRRMDNLRRKRNRAAELGGFDDDRPRRSTGRVSSGGTADRGASGLSSNDNESAGAGDPYTSDADTGGFLGGDEAISDPTVVLADVVDSDTLNALRRAENSGDPLIKAKAAERAHKQVRAQLQRLRRRRLIIERRAKRLRKD